jgi:hypothetical protein
MAVINKITVFWHVTLSGLVDHYLKPAASTSAKGVLWNTGNNSPDPMASHSSGQCCSQEMMYVQQTFSYFNLIYSNFSCNPYLKKSECILIHYKTIISSHSWLCFLLLVFHWLHTVRPQLTVNIISWNPNWVFCWNKITLLEQTL